MRSFELVRATTIGDAVRAVAGPEAAVVAGGTNLVDLMKYDVARPARLVDISALKLDRIEDTEDGGLMLGAFARNADTAADPRVIRRYPLLASAILAGASPQLRNAATNGGNLLQRTRCYYFYDIGTPCNKREPGTGCPAREGRNRNQAILGWSESCIATHPSDMCVALAALDAKVHVTGPAGERSIPFADCHRLPGNEPEKDNTLVPGEIVTGIALPPDDFGDHTSYLKLRDRLSYAFALVSVAAALQLEDGRIADARIALGGVAHKPWRDRGAEELLIGKAPEDQGFDKAAARLLEGAKGHGDNDFKIELARRAIRRALSQAAAGTPQSQTDKRIA